MMVNMYRMKINKEAGVFLCKEKSFNYISDNQRITSPDEFVKMMNTLFQLNEQGEEYVYMLAMNNTKPVGIFEVSHGSMDCAYISPREIFRKALLCGGTHVLLCHNHPSQECIPSKADIHMTKRIKEAGNMLGLELVDHIIVAGDEYLSFKEKELL